MDYIVIALYMLGMIGIGVWATKRSKNDEDFLVAGRRLGPLLYSGTMAAVVLGGASTVGAVGLGYQYGISGMWLVFSIGCGLLLLSLAFAAWINRLEVYTVAQMFELRYGPGASLLTGIVMAAYTFMLSVTSTVAYGTIFGVLFELDRVPAILLGGGVVIAYSVLGGMWSITLTDFVQFIVKTIGIFFIMLPILLVKAGGWEGMHAALPETAFSITHIGTQTIITYFVVYFLGLVIGQDIWQRVFTAKSEGVAKWAGFTSGVYCILYAFAGALIGMCAKVLLPNIEVRDTVYPTIVEYALPAGIAGLVMAAALSAIMSTSSGALIATATVVKEDIVDKLAPSQAGARAAQGERDEVRNSRIYILIFGILMIAAACVVRGVVEALTIAYDILVGGLMVAIIGGFLWPRGTIKGALASIIAGTALTLGTMFVMKDVFANEPIFFGIVGSFVVYVVVSLMTAPTPAAIRDEWNRRKATKREEATV
ncbi:MAG: sodium:solute symporter [Proteobacteria bacterium]|nr:sodium:solute symporter [Pseudomonadota bacterium]